MLNAKAFANAVTAVTAVFYLVCALLSYIAPNLIFGLAKSWVHSINMEIVKMNYVPNLGILVYGLVTIAAITWITTYAVVWLYNRWVK